MSELNLSPEARRRLWQCYSLLIELAEEAEKTNTTTDSEVCESQNPARATKANDLTRQDSDTFEVEQEQKGIEKQPNKDSQDIQPGAEVAGPIREEE